MSPRDTLKRMVQSASPERVKPVHPVVSKVAEAQARLTEIMAEVAAIPVDHYIPYLPKQVYRSPAAPLRWFAVVDVLVLIAAFFVSWLMAGAAHTMVLDKPFPRLGIEGDAVSMVHYGLVAAGVVLWCLHTGHYRRRMPFWMEAQKVASVFGVAMLIHGFLQFAAKQDFSRVWLVGGWVVAALGVLFTRHLVREVMRRTGDWQLRTLLVGGGKTADEARAAMQSAPSLGYEIVAQIENLPVLLGHIDGSWEQLCERFKADYVVLALEGAELDQAEPAIDSLVRSGMPFAVAPPLRHVPVLGMSGQSFFSHDVILMEPVNNLEQVLPRTIKRAMDIAGAGLAFLVFSPLFLVLAALVKKDGGPVFFADVRVGREGSAFHCLKFRSMVTNGDEVFKKYLEQNPDKKVEWETYHKLRDEDPRVTAVGAFMRRWSLDELPQLLNVLRGDMSLVGPRPIMFRERNVYSKSLSHYARVRPGLTGVWQVSGRSDVTFARRVQMDSWYVRNWSLWHDIAILCKTVPAILKKTGAY